MSQPGAKGVDVEPARSAATEGVVSMALAHASVLARSGQLEGAAAVLEGVASMSPPEVRALDLLAKVRAQQGRWDAAEQLWARANGLGEAGAFDAALKRVQAMKQRPTWFGPARVGAAAACALVVLLVMGAKLIGGGAAHHALALPGAVAQPEPAPVPVAEAKLAQKAPVMLELEVPGARAVRRGDSVQFTFVEGLFSEGTTLTTGGTKALEELGARLRQVPVGATVIVTGCTDDVPVAPGRGYQDNTALGLARASVAMERLKAAAGRPARDFLLGTAGGANGPYPNDSSGSRQRNRTVVIQVKLPAST